MKFINLFTLLLLAINSGCGGFSGRHTQAASPTNEVQVRPVIVELFTSEGCSSCPPADKQLEFLAKQQPVTGADIITLAFHVDYWDSPNWRDRFSSPLFSRRQELYARQLKLDSAYTPQIVVDGRKEVIATDFNKTLLAIMESAKLVAGSISATASGNTVRFEVTGLPEHGPSTLYLAAAEDYIGSKVSGGENAGTKFRHMSVVRELKAVTAIPAGAEGISVECELPYVPTWKKDNLKYAAFVQDNADRRIIAAARIIQ